MNKHRGGPPTDDLTPGTARERLGAAEREIDALRAELDTRLAALESAMARPESRPELEDLVLALARVATDEARSTASRAVLAAHVEAQESATAAVSELQTAIYAERANAEGARAALEKMQTTLDAARNAAARLERERDSEREAVARLRAELEHLEATANASVSAEDRLRELELLLERERTQVASLETAFAQEHETATQERDTAARLWDTVSTLRQALEEERRRVDAEQAVALERIETADARAAQLQAERDELAAQLQAIETQLAETQQMLAATVAGERERPATEPESARTGSTVDAKMMQLLKAAAERIRVLEFQLAERQGAPGEEVDLEAAAASASPVLAQAGQRARRFGFPARTKVRIDHEDAQLVDLSLTGAQLICRSSPEVGRVVLVTLPSEAAPCFGQGRLLWARREPTPSGRPQRYRAGIVFTEVDQTSVEAFIKTHAIPEAE